MQFSKHSCDTRPHVWGSLWDSNLWVIFCLPTRDCTNTTSLYLLSLVSSGTRQDVWAHSKFELTDNILHATSSLYKHNVPLQSLIVAHRQRSWAPSENRTHSLWYASKAFWPLYSVKCPHQFNMESFFKVCLNSRIYVARRLTDKITKQKLSHKPTEKEILIENTIYILDIQQV